VDNIGGLAVLVVIWIVGAIFDKKKKEERRRRAAGSSAPTPIEVESVSMSEGGDPSQLEGSMLENVLRQLDPQLADRALGKRQSTANAELERQPSRPTTAPVAKRAVRPEADDRSAATRATLTDRREAAEERTTGRADSDHSKFHDSIRKPEKVEPREDPFPVSDMRRAFVWREVLGPPKAETIDEWH
jgi:hypothetical protein